MAKKKATVTRTETVQKSDIKRLYRSQTDKVIAGVCGGMGEYFEVDPVWLRILLVLLVFCFGIGLLMYIIMWIIVPKNPNVKVIRETVIEEKVRIVETKIKNRDKSKHKGQLYLGILMVVIGILLIVGNMYDNLIPSWILWGGMVILLGFFLILKTD